MFRNGSSGSAIATTYWWHDGSRILDADIVLWDGSFRFFAGSSGCSGGFYIEDIAAHEFGHALGLGHSTSPTATMYPSAFTCDSSVRSLDADDISGVRALYPPGLAPAAANRVPNRQIAQPRFADSHPRNPGALISSSDLITIRGCLTEICASAVGPRRTFT